MAYALLYRSFARYLSALPLSATCADLAAAIRAYPECGVVLRERLAVAVELLPLERGFLDGLTLVAEMLEADNARFLPVLFMEWVLENV